MQIWTHRGKITPKSKGNTQEDFLLSAQNGAHGIETDVVLTRDKQPIIYHPGDISPEILGTSWMHVHENHPEVLHLTELMGILLDYPDLYCCLDLKQQSDLLVSVVLERIFQARLSHRIYVTAPQTALPWLGLYANGEMLNYAARCAPAIQNHVIACFPHDLIEIAEFTRARTISLGVLPDSLLSKTAFWCFEKYWRLSEQIEQCKKEGITVWGGIANTEKNIQHFVSDLGVEGLFTENLECALTHTS